MDFSIKAVLNTYYPFKKLGETEAEKEARLIKEKDWKEHIWATR